MFELIAKSFMMFTLDEIFKSEMSLLRGFVEVYQMEIFYISGVKPSLTKGHTGK